MRNEELSLFHHIFALKMTFIAQKGSCLFDVSVFFLSEVCS